MPLPLPISPAVALTKIITPALDILPAKMSSDAADIMLLAVALQESGLRAREQDGGPARGLWQMEQGGGVRGVLMHPTTAAVAQMLCDARGIPASAHVVYIALADDDILAAGFARLLLWTDPHRLPNDAMGGWELYLRTWRPGKPRPRDWPGNYATAATTGADDGG